MQTKISARHGHLSERSQAKIQERVEKLTRYFNRITEIAVTVDLENKDRPKVEIIVQAEHKNDFVSHDESDDMMYSLDACIAKMEQQIKKYKDKLQDHHRSEKPRNFVPEEQETID